jgi:hypothetical protein
VSGSASEEDAMETFDLMNSRSSESEPHRQWGEDLKEVPKVVRCNLRLVVSLVHLRERERG